LLPTYFAAAAAAEAAVVGVAPGAAAVVVSAPAKAGRNNRQAAANAVRAQIADERNGNGDNSETLSLAAPTGLAVGLAPREWRYFADRDDSPHARSLGPVGPPLPDDRSAGIRLVKRPAERSEAGGGLSS